MDETVLEPTGGNASEAKREEPKRRILESKRPAPLGIRAAARVIDFIVLLLLFEFLMGHTRRELVKSVFIILSGILGVRMEGTAFHVLAFSVLVGAVFLRLAAIYFLSNYWSLSGSGRSIGKRMTQICIADVGEDEGCPLRPPGFSRIFRREALFILAITPFFVARYYGPPPSYKTFGYCLSVSLPVLGLLPAFFASRRSVLDRVSGTRVCDLKPVEPESSPSPSSSVLSEADGSGAFRESRENELQEGALEPVSLWRRGYARTIDFVVLALVMDFTDRVRDYILHGVLWLFRFFGLRNNGEDPEFFLIGGILLSYLLYTLFVYLLMNYVKLRRSGQSIGKGVGRVRIVCLEGGRMGIVRMLLREAPFLISVSLLVFTMDFTLGIRFSSPSFIWDRWWEKLGVILTFYAKLAVAVLSVDALPGLFGSGRCVHDYLADTRVCGAKAGGGGSRVLRGRERVL